MNKHKQAKPFLTILIPAYNEEKRILKTLREYAACQELNRICEFEVKVILNGCRDNTFQVVKKATQEFPAKIKFIEEKRSIQKGGAIKLGFEQSLDSDLIAFTDADSSTSAKMIARITKVLISDKSLDATIGSRYIKGSKVKGKAFKRIVISEIFSLIVNLLFFLDIKDTQCGGKVFRNEIVKKLLPHFKIKNMAFDVNLLYHIKKMRGKIKEVPIEWQDDTESSLTGKTHITSFFMLYSLFRMRVVYSPLNFLYQKLLKKIDKYIWVKLLKQEWEGF